jgi:hypothetical protein
MAKVKMKARWAIHAGKHGQVPAGGIVFLDDELPAHAAMIDKGHVVKPGSRDVDTVDGEPVDLTVDLA